MLASPVSSFLIAPTGQESSHGTDILTIALYGHAFTHIWHFLHFSSSITERPLTIETAPNLQDDRQGLATQP